MDERASERANEQTKNCVKMTSRRSFTSLTMSFLIKKKKQNKLVDASMLSHKTLNYRIKKVQPVFNLLNSSKDMNNTIRLKQISEVFFLSVFFPHDSNISLKNNELRENLQIIP